MKNLIIILLAFFFSCVSCISQEQKDNDQIKETVTKYWKALNPAFLFNIKAKVGVSDRNNFYFIKYAQ